MRDLLDEVLVVLSYSARTQLAIFFGVLSFLGIMLAGGHFVGRLGLHGVLAPLTDVIREQIWHRYDKAAWGALVGFLLLAVKFYRKDRKRLLGL